MRAWRLAACAAATLLLLPTGPAGACGDKFVRVGRGGRSQRGYVAVHPASILVYVNRASGGAGAMQKLPAALKAAGHKAQAADTPAAFGEALKAGKFDLVLAEQADLAGLEGALQGATPRPGVLPVLRNASKAEAEAAAKKHGCVIEDPEKKQDVLVDIDQMMEKRAQ